MVHQSTPAAAGDNVTVTRVMVARHRVGIVVAIGLEEEDMAKFKHRDRQESLAWIWVSELL
jgi:hypothetical protein